MVNFVDFVFLFVMVVVLFWIESFYILINDWFFDFFLVMFNIFLVLGKYLFLEVFNFIVCICKWEYENNNSNKVLVLLNLVIIFSYKL